MKIQQNVHPAGLPATAAEHKLRCLIKTRGANSKVIPSCKKLMVVLVDPFAEAHVLQLMKGLLA